MLKNAIDDVNELAHRGTHDRHLGFPVGEKSLLHLH